MANVRAGSRTLISGACLITLDAQRRIIRDGALAFEGDRIVAVGGRREVEERYARDECVERIDGRRFVMTPGFVDAHVHITGDPLTRGYVPDDIGGDFTEKLTRWVLPRFLAQTEDDERLSAQLAAIQMLRSGTTCFLEAGTVRQLDAVVDGLRSTGIRARVGAWVEGRAQQDGQDETKLTDAAIRMLEDEVARYPAAIGDKVGAWPLLVGHSTNPQEVWRVAKALADAHGLGVSAHMSPYRSDAEWYLARFGCRPIEYLDRIGVLGNNIALTHVTHLSSEEQQLLARAGAHAIFCPLASLKGAFGMAREGRFPELDAAGVNVALGTDGGLPDLMRELPVAAALFKDARTNPALFPAQQVLSMAIRGGAQLLRLQSQIGALEVGHKADIVLHDTDRPEWQPLVDPVQQLVWCADGRSVHSVWVDGVRLVDDHRSTQIDEGEVFSRARAASEALLRRSGVPKRSAWPES